METNRASITVSLSDGGGLVSNFSANSEREIEAKLKAELDNFFAERARKRKWKSASKRR